MNIPKIERPEPLPELPNLENYPQALVNAIIEKEFEKEEIENKN